MRNFMFHIHVGEKPENVLKPSMNGRSVQSFFEMRVKFKHFDQRSNSQGKAKPFNLQGEIPTDNPQ